MQILGGIRQTAPAWDQVEIRPCFIADSAKVIIPSPKGKIHSSWKRKGDAIQGTLNIPKGVEATLRLLDEKPAIVRGRCTYEIPSTPLE